MTALMWLTIAFLFGFLVGYEVREHLLRNFLIKEIKKHKETMAKLDKKRDEILKETEELKKKNENLKKIT